LEQIQLYYFWAWIPFVAFLVITGFVIVNLIIAVICDAVRVMGDEKKNDLTGGMSPTNRSTDPAGDMSPTNGSNLWGMAYDVDRPFGAVNVESGALDRVPRSALHRLQLLQRQLDETVVVQEQMMSKIELLTELLTKLLQDKE
jgi:hypothetical protein